MGIVGLWAGLAVGISLASIIFVRLVLKTDWQMVADEAETRILEE